MEQTKTLPPLVSDRPDKNWLVQNDLIGSKAAEHVARFGELKRNDKQTFGCGMEACRAIYEADRQRTREVVQALCNGIETMRQGSFADRFIFADDADLGAHADSLLALAKSRLQIEPTK